MKQWEYRELGEDFWIEDEYATTIMMRTLDGKAVINLPPSAFKLIAKLPEMVRATKVFLEKLEQEDRYPSGGFDFEDAMEPIMELAKKAGFLDE